MTEKKPFRVLFVSSVAVGLLSAVIRIILTATVYDREYNLYNSGTVLPTVYHVVLVVACVAAVVSALLISGKKQTLCSMRFSTFTVFTAFFTGFAMAGASLLSLFVILRERIAGASEIPALETAIAVVQLISSIYFFSLVKLKGERKNSLAIMSFFPAACAILQVMKVYFDRKVLVSSPAKSITEIAFVAIALYFLNESRIQLNIFSEKMFMAASSAAIILVLTACLPAVIFPSLLLISDSVAFSDTLVGIAIALFIMSRTFDVTFDKKKA